MKVLLIQQKMIGDVLVSSLLCKHLKSHLPGVEVHYMIHENTAAVVENNPYIDRLLLFKHEYKKDIWLLFGFLRSITRERYDAVIDVYGKPESNLASLFSRASIRVAYYKPYSAFLYNHTVKLNPNKTGRGSTTIEDRISLLRPLIPGKPGTADRPSIHLTEREVSEARNFLLEKGVSFSRPVIMLGILGSTPSKTYPLPYMARLIEIVADQTPATFLFNYIPEQEASANELFLMCRIATQKRIAIRAFARDLRNFLGLLKHCDCIIGNEGGSTNMAKALGVPTFSIFAPWIDKKGWHTFADSSNIAIHPEDYYPEVFVGKSYRQICSHSAEIYQLMEPDAFKKELFTFLDTVLQANT